MSDDLTIDLDAAATFQRAHARLLDQHRLQLLLGRGDADATLAALTAYRNPDGGFGHGLEPDLRSPESQPAPALHAFEVLAELGPVTSPLSAALCDWLDSVTLPDGGLPFALPVTSPSGCAPFWVSAEHDVSSLQITAITAACALRVAAHDPAVAAHPWLRRATEYSFDAIRALEGRPHALVLAFAVGFLDAASDSHPEAVPLLERLGEYVPADGLVPVEGGAEGESMRPLDFAPLPGRPARNLFKPEVVDAELRALAAAQQDDGGWRVDFTSYSPAASLEWRGYRTVSAVHTLLTA
ncbi:hypothetical protein [Prauserella cavernicola]|uniref:Prenyltransferase n=1 Tax=Prauserella cavernicola TaxID=2800127 RepID=A0A934V2Q4_9PSEU|nr:hypothetical protein [Prauserella cavernicola]MBK1786281.1 hypothetical protein [Prauserella cavernicola]